MHFVIPQNLLAPVIDTVSRAVASRPTHPILANIMLVADDDEKTVTLTAFDLNIGIKLTVAAQVVTGGAITLPAKLLGDIVSRLPDEDVTLSTTPATEGLVTLVCGSGKYQLNGIDVAEFPELPKIAEGDSFDISVNTLREGLAATLIATSKDETKRILTGVHFVSTSESLEFAATDGHRLSVLKTTVDNGQEFTATIPHRALTTLDRLIGNQDLPIAVTADNANAIFTLPNGTLVTRLLDGTYPRYDQLIPKTFERKVVVERKLLVSALERIAVLADTKNNIVKITVDATGQEVSLSVESPDVAAGSESLPAQVSGEDLVIALNVGYLKDGLKTMHSNEIQLQMNNATSPVVLSPVSGDDQVYLLMPVQVRS